MRTTIDIQDELLAQAKQFASSSNKRLSDVVNDALREVLQRADQRTQKTPEPYRAITYGSGGVMPGIDLHDNGSIQDTMDAEFLDPETGRYDLNKLR